MLQRPSMRARGGSGDETTREYLCFKSAMISVLIARSHSDDNHVNVTAPCMPCTRIHMHFAQARPPMSCIPLVYIHAQV